MTLVGVRRLRLGELYLCLYRRPFHPELFHIRASQELRTDHYVSDVWLVGCAHVITFRTGDAVLSEVIAADETPLGMRRRLQRWRLRGERSCEQTIADGRLGYIASFQVESMSDHLYGQLHRELVRESQRRGMIAEFPEWRTSPLTPFSYINCEPCARELRVHAFHGLPDEHVVIKTQSIFELK